MVSNQQDTVWVGMDGLWQPGPPATAVAVIGQNNRRNLVNKQIYICNIDLGR